MGKTRRREHVHPDQFYRTAYSVLVRRIRKLERENREYRRMIENHLIKSAQPIPERLWREAEDEESAL